MILKITDLENYTQFINTQPLYNPVTVRNMDLLAMVNPVLPEGQQLVQADAFESAPQNQGLPSYTSESVY